MNLGIHGKVALVTGGSQGIGRADEVAPVVVFLCSAKNTAVTGEIVRASGGRPYPY